MYSETNDRQTRIVAIHDISCLGKCSLTAVLPILSAAGIETAIIPTAVLSTHTGGFKGFTFRDLTEDIMPIVEHWKREKIDFDAVYTGYLGSFEQIDIMKRIFDIYGSKGAIIMVDPVMADNGRLYSAFTDDFPRGMRMLCEKADIITPNITEAILLLGEEYKEGPYTREYIEGLIQRLTAICKGKIVLTGVYFDSKQLGAACYDPEKGRIEYYLTKKEKGMYHGTGDVFASALLSEILNGKSLEASTRTAVEFVAEAIRQTLRTKTDRCYGVNFEAALPVLIK